MTAVRVRKAGVGDATAIAVAHVLSWQAAYEGLVPQDYLDGLDPVRRRELWDVVLAEDVWPRSGALVAENGAGGMGYWRWQAVDDQLAECPGSCGLPGGDLVGTGYQCTGQAFL
jgi:hypothetical protein